MGRRESREKMMTLAYQMECKGRFDQEEMSKFIEDVKPKQEAGYCNRLLKALCGNIEEIDRQISENSNRWKIGRIPKVDLSILRVAVCEINYMDDVPNEAAINEAVELAKVYCDENSPGYINGILGSVVKGI